MTTAFKIGSLAQDAITGIKHLLANTVTGSHYMSFEFPAGTDYEVTAGKTFYITKIIACGQAADNEFLLLYGDTGVAVGAGAPTNPVEVITTIRFPLTSVPNVIDCFIPIPAGKFPCMQGITVNCFLNIEGIEL